MSAQAAMYLPMPASCRDSRAYCEEIDTSSAIHFTKRRIAPNHFGNCRSHAI